MDKIVYRICEFLCCIGVGVLGVAAYESSPIASAIFIATGLWIAFKVEK